MNPNASEYDRAGMSWALIENVCHGAATRNGWWTDLKTGESLIGKRNVGEMFMLAVSEIAEAMEGHRKHKMDDKLPHRPMLEVELADCCIRLADTSGALRLNVEEQIQRLIASANPADFAIKENVSETLLLICNDIGFAYGSHVVGDVDAAARSVACVILRIALLGQSLGLDIGGAITEKMVFNDNRPDHKREARLAAGGKAF